MAYEGHVEHGRVLLDEPVELPEGAKVRVEVLPCGPGAETPAAIASLYERLKPFIGVLEGLPEDAAANHDHYLYGTPKKP